MDRRVGQVLGDDLDLLGDLVAGDPPHQLDASSRPEETPPPVTRLRSTTKRGLPSATWISGKACRQGMNAPWVVAV